MTEAEDILKAFRPRQLRHFRCRSCEGEWDSLYDYMRCPVCKSEDVEVKGWLDGSGNKSNE